MMLLYVDTRCLVYVHIEWHQVRQLWIDIYSQNYTQTRNQQNREKNFNYTLVLHRKIHLSIAFYPRIKFSLMFYCTHTHTKVETERHVQIETGRNTPIQIHILKGGKNISGRYSRSKNIQLSSNERSRARLFATQTHRKLYSSRVKSVSNVHTVIFSLQVTKHCFPNRTHTHNFTFSHETLEGKKDS